jgi:signal transduction histidine kinase
MRVPAILKSYRAVLWMGFGSLLAIILLIGWKGSQVVAQLESQSNALRAAYVERDELLDSVRFALSQSASSIRDLLLEDDPALVRQHQTELQAQRRQISDAIERYGRDLPPDEAALWQQLRRRVNAYWNAIEPAFRWDAGTRRRQAEDFLRRQVMPRQGELLSLISQVDQSDHRNLQESNRRISDLFKRFGAELAFSTLAASFLGAVLASLTVRRVLALEQAGERRLREVTQARSELQDLSHRVVTVQEEERRRVARELHDEVGQALSAVLVELGRAGSRLPPESDTRAHLALARELAERAVAQVRDMALLLRPSMLDDLGLVPALKWQAREVARRTGVKVKVAAETVPDDLPDTYRTCIYRVVQEALNNAARHARASWARVEAVQENGSIRVTIQDNGSGFDPSQEKGMGILGMEERVKGLGGLFHIDSEKGSGTIVSLVIPIARIAAEVPQ